MSYFFSIFFGTFVLEDLALASSLALIGEQKLSFASAFLACFLGISLGDIGLYLLGFATAKFSIEKRFKFFKRYEKALTQLKNAQTLTYAIVISRLIPGTRLPTYIGAGYLRYPLLKFTWLTISSVFLWVFAALIAGKSLQTLFKGSWLITIVLFLFLLSWLKGILPKLADPWQRKALLFTWRQWLHFEFWPAYVFYLPVVPIYIFLWIRHRNPFMPFYASPHLANGGLIGESKWDFIKHLNSSETSTLKAEKIGKNQDFLTTKKILDLRGFSYPFILKPDIGQRGFGVRIIRNDFDLTEYLLLSDFDRIAQRLSTYSYEAGIFYVRRPHQEFGTIFSLTDKKFPFVTGDGSTKLGDLILQDKRARIIAPVYFARLKNQLNSIPQEKEIIFLSECGNHCQGAIFENGQRLITDTLTRKLDHIAKQIPDFYFGRFDVKYKSPDALKLGEEFEIVEINGAGSEATHIWDSKTSLIEAYKVLFRQWSLLFEIGAHQISTQKNLYKLSFIDFIKEVVKINCRKTDLSVSS